MAVKIINETYTKGQQYTYTKTYMIDLENHATSIFDFQTEIPDEIGDTLGSLRCTEINVNWQDGTKVATADVIYTTNQSEVGGDSTLNITPLSRPQEIRWGEIHYEKPITHYYDVAEEENRAIENTIGELYTNITKDEIRPTLSITRNEATFSASTILSFVNRVNDDTFFGASAGQAKCTSIQAENRSEIFEGSEETYWSITYNFEFSQDGHQLKLLNEGTYYIDSALKKKPKDGEGNETGEVVPLQSDGTKATAPEDLHILTFNLYPEADFDTLSLE